VESSALPWRRYLSRPSPCLHISDDPKRGVETSQNSRGKLGWIGKKGGGFLFREEGYARMKVLMKVLDIDGIVVMLGISFDDIQPTLEPLPSFQSRESKQIMSDDVPKLHAGLH
jgi:hypothetical protein